MSKIHKSVLVILAVLALSSITNCEKNRDRNLPVDADGNVYNTVVIGTQTWLKENLKTTKYNNGTPIPLLENNDEWASTKTGAYCWYNNDAETYKDAYGALYNWYSVETGLLCPTGWHVPTHEEWEVLINYFGGEIAAGSRLKEVGLVHWKSPNIDANNISGFTALGGGMRNRAGGFSFIKEWCEFWSSTEGDSTWAYNRSLNYYDSRAGYSGWSKTFGFSVRCLKD
jgi:uncharacterized protein (TIGR02145 family)